MSDAEEEDRKQKPRRRSSGQDQVDIPVAGPQEGQPPVAASSPVHPLTISPDLSFPWRLYIMLSNTAEDGFEDIVSWTNNGTAFQVYDVEQFELKVLPKYFKMTKYNSFTRQLYAYGFSWQKSGPAKGGYQQPVFSKNNPSACYNMERAKDRRGSRKRDRPQNIVEPFYGNPGNDQFETKPPARADTRGTASDGISSNDFGNINVQVNASLAAGAVNARQTPNPSQQQYTGTISNPNLLFNPGVASSLSSAVGINIPEQQNSIYSAQQRGYIEQTDASLQSFLATQGMYEASEGSSSGIARLPVASNDAIAVAQVEGRQHGASSLPSHPHVEATMSGHGGTTISRHPSSIVSASTGDQLSSRTTSAVSSDSMTSQQLRQREALGFSSDDLEPRSIEDMVEEPDASNNNNMRPPSDCQYHGGTGL